MRVDKVNSLLPNRNESFAKRVLCIPIYRRSIFDRRDCIKGAHSRILDNRHSNRSSRVNA